MKLVGCHLVALCLGAFAPGGNTLEVSLDVSEGGRATLGSEEGNFAVDLSNITAGLDDPEGEIFGIEVQGFINEMDDDEEKANATMQHLVQLAGDLKEPTLKGMTGGLAGLVRNLLRDVMLGHNKDVKSLSSTLYTFVKCSGPFHRRSTAVDSHKNRKLDSSYRYNEKTEGRALKSKIKWQGLVDSCNKQVAALKKVRKTLCDAHTSYQNVDSKAIGKSCMTTGKEMTSSWVRRMQKYVAREMKKARNLRRKCDSAVRAVIRPEKACEAKHRKLAERVDYHKNRVGQTLLAKCTWKTARELECKNYHSCHKTQKKAFKEFKKAMRKKTAQRKLQYRMLKRLECLVKAFSQWKGKVNSAALDACATVGVYNTDQWHIVLPRAPKPQICDGELPRKISASDCRVKKRSLLKRLFKKKKRKVRKYLSTQCTKDVRTTVGMCAFGYTQEPSKVSCEMSRVKVTWGGPKRTSTPGTKAECVWAYSPNSYLSGQCSTKAYLKKQCRGGNVLSEQKCKVSPRFRQHYMAVCGYR
jgi:hypothetical protein